jgi:hypothetical protein
VRFVLLEDIVGRVARKYDPRAQDPLSQLTSALISREHVSTGARALVESMQCSDGHGAFPDAAVKDGGNQFAPLEGGLTWFRRSFRKPKTANFA